MPHLSRNPLIKINTILTIMSDTLLKRSSYLHLT
nr:MAG TPA: hypothetical protein [Caudoviricetes sp.]